MDFRRVALLAGALLVAAISAIIARSLFSEASTPAGQAAPLPSVQVMVAAQSLSIGTMIEPSMIRFQPWPKDMVDPSYVTQGDPSALKGQVVRYAIAAGQPITSGALVKPGDRGFLAAALGPGMRAVTVNVNPSSGVAGFIFPGDRVDVVVTQQVTGGGSGEPLKVSETFVRNIRVLATDQRTSSESAEGEAATPKPATTVTLEATPRIAEKIAVAQSIGQISLSLRSIADNAAEVEAAIANGEITIPEGTDSQGEKKLLLALASRPVDTKGSFSTGGDVSRFQRSTVPAAPPQPDQDPQTLEANRLQQSLRIRDLRKQLAEQQGINAGVTVRRGGATSVEGVSAKSVGGQ